MARQQEKNLQLAKAWWAGLVHNDPKHHLGAVSEYCLNTNIHYTSFGMGCGNTELSNATIAFHSIFKITSPPIILNCSAWGDFVSFNSTKEMCQVGTFRGIAATHKSAIQKTTVACEIHRDKITSFSILENTEDLLTQIIGSEQAQMHLAIPALQTTPLQSITQLCGLFRQKNIRITHQQLRCLSLWYAQYSYKEIAKLLGNISPNTVEAYLNIVKTACCVDNRRQLFEFLVTNGLLDTLLVCNRLIMKEKGLSFNQPDA